jgi:hypothetical protein
MIMKARILALSGQISAVYADPGALRLRLLLRRRRKGTERRADRFNNRRRELFDVSNHRFEVLIPGVKRRKLLLADNAGKGTRKRVHPKRTRFVAVASAVGRMIAGY